MNNTYDFGQLKHKNNAELVHFTLMAQSCLTKMQAAEEQGNTLKTIYWAQATISHINQLHRIIQLVEVYKKQYEEEVADPKHIEAALELINKLEI